MKIASIGFLAAISVLSIGQILAQPSGPPSFADIDNNQDGVLTVDEMRELPAVRNRGVNVDRLFNALDGDGNGSVTEEEWIARPRPGGMGMGMGMGMAGRGGTGMGR
jgi:hypothetical protein